MGTKTFNDDLAEIFKYNQDLPKAMAPAGFVRYCKLQGYCNYCEGIIDRQGKVYPMRGSHSMMLAKIFAHEHHQTMDEFYSSVPKKYYANMDYYTSKGTGAISIRYDFCQGASIPNKAQAATLKLLITNGLIKDNFVQLRNSNEIVKHIKEHIN